ARRRGSRLHAKPLPRESKTRPSMRLLLRAICEGNRARRRKNDAQPREARRESRLSRDRIVPDPAMHARAKGRANGAPETAGRARPDRATFARTTLLGRER